MRTSALGADVEVVLAPGLLCDERLWATVIARLSVPATVARFMDDTTLAEMAMRVLRASPRRMVIAGFSMGAMAAILAAAQAPARVLGLVLISTHADADTGERAAARVQHIALAQAGGFDRLVAEELTPLYFADPSDHPAERSLVADMARRQGADVFRRHVGAILTRPDLASAAAQVRAPTRVVVGREDRLVTPDAAHRLAAMMTGADLTVIDRCGHLAPLERPAEIAALIDALLAAELSP